MVMSEGPNEKTQLTKRGDTPWDSPSPKTSPLPESSSLLDIDQAIERLGCGFGTTLFCSACYIFLVVEGAELVAMSTVSVMVQCEWHLSDSWVSVLMSSAHISHFLAAALLADLGDKFGRKRVMLGGAVGIVTAGILSGMCAELWQLMVCRCVLGFSGGVGSGPAASYICELPPLKHRTIALSSLGLGWGIGTAISSAMAFLTIGMFGWRGYLISVSLVFSVSLPIFIFMCESPRYDYKKGNDERALKTLIMISKLNCKPQSVDFKLHSGPVQCSAEPRNIYQRYRALGNSNSFKDFWLLVFCTLFVQFTYMTVIWVTPHFMNDGYCNREPEKADQSEKSCTFDNRILFNLGIVAVAEPIATGISLVLIDRVGRRPIFMACSILPFLLLFLLYICVKSPLYITIITCLIRGTLAVVGWSNFLLAAELFPTSVRSFTSSIVTAGFSGSAVAASFASRAVYEANPQFVVLMMQITAFLGCFFLFFLKRETMGQQLQL